MLATMVDVDASDQKEYIKKFNNIILLCDTSYLPIIFILDLDLIEDVHHGG